MLLLKKLLEIWLERREGFMEKLEIYQKYLFKKGGAEFYVSEGDRLRIKLSSGEIEEGHLAIVGSFSECFDIDTGIEVLTINCEDVVDIIPV